MFALVSTLKEEEETKGQTKESKRYTQHHGKHKKKDAISIVRQTKLSKS